MVKKFTDFIILSGSNNDFHSVNMLFDSFYFGLRFVPDAQILNIPDFFAAVTGYIKKNVIWE